MAEVTYRGLVLTVLTRQAKAWAITSWQVCMKNEKAHKLKNPLISKLRRHCHVGTFSAIHTDLAPFLAGLHWYVNPPTSIIQRGSTYLFSVNNNSKQCIFCWQEILVALLLTQVNACLSLPAGLHKGAQIRKEWFPGVGISFCTPLTPWFVSFVYKFRYKPRYR